MKNSFSKFIREISKKIWEGFLQNLGVLISAFILSGGYLVAINKIKKFQVWVRSIPTDYVLTPFVLLIIAIIVLSRFNYKQRQKISKLEREPITNERDSRFVTHLGVWWKIYPDAEYIEDFPYCPCCDPKMKLVQIDWHPDEIYKCPKTDTEYKLYDTIPTKREEVLSGLYRAYFRGLGSRFESEFYSERDRLKRLNPDISDKELSEKLFELEPLCKIPKKEKDEIFQRYPNPASALQFIEDHFSRYKQYFKKKTSEKT